MAKPNMANENQPMQIRLFGRTDVGQVREHNEDNFLVANLSTGKRGLTGENRTPVVGDGGILLGVCDGMGGAAAGEVASQMAVDIIYEYMQSGGPAHSPDELARRLVQSIEHAGAQIFQEARSDRSRRGMGTTATIAAFLDRRLFVGQVGDSRAYLLREGKLALLSRDQSLVNQLIEAGQLSEEEAETFEHNNIILQALGTTETVQVDLTYVDLRKGDILMMCSDGLNGMIRADEIRDVLLNNPEPLDACRELTERANAAGGHDNITVIVAHFDDGLSDPDQQSTFGYQKYALPDVTPEAPQAAANGDQKIEYQAPLESELSDEAVRESRNLRVSHTMVGMVNPMAQTPISKEVPHGLAEAARLGETNPAVESNRGRDTSASSRGFAARSSHPPSEDPFALPTTGFPPALMGIIITCAMLLAGLFGYLLMK